MEGPPSKQKPRINDTGISTLHDPKEAIADIIFVHGLQGHPRKTWTCNSTAPNLENSNKTTRISPWGIRKLLSFKHKIGSEDGHEHRTHEVFWPLDLLPGDCSNARILTWGYDSKVSHYFSGPASQSNITAHAKNLLAALRICRLGSQQRSLIFVAHSLGGIIVKDVLRRAATDTEFDMKDIYASTEAILFLGTPHRGSGKAEIAEVLRKIVSVSGFDTTNQNIRSLQIDSTELELIHELFMRLYGQNDRHFKVLTFQEAKGVTGISYLKMNERVVEPFSSSLTGTEPTQTINANHMSMCRYPSRDDEGYRQVSGEIQILISNIQKRKEHDLLEMERNIANLKTGSPSQMTTASAASSLNDVERKCMALLTQNTQNVAEYKSSLPSRVEGTCQWILSNSQYRDWSLQNETCLLWISGYPGSGKTILSAYLLEYLSAGELSPGLRTTLCYFFCDEKIDTQRDGKAILRSIIHQLPVRRRLLIKYVKTAYDFHGPQFDRSFNELWRIFVAMAGDKRIGPISVIIDAIDECEERTRERFLRSIVELIDRSRSTGSSTPCIRFLITSRPFLGRVYTTNYLQIDQSQSHIEQDLRLVIQTKVDGIAKRTQCKPAARAYLENALYSKADRTFLWVMLVLHLLERSLLASQRDFMRIIDELPNNLTTTYERFLQGISTEYQTLATRLLHFLVGSSRPLTLDEMRILIAVQDHHRNVAEVEEDAQPNMRKTIEGVLGPLVRVWDSRIYLVHQSLKEFLHGLLTRTESPLSATYGIDPSKANLLLAKACVSYLLLEDFKDDLFSKDRSDTTGSPDSTLTIHDDVGSIEQTWDPFDLGEDNLFKDSEESEAEACVSITTQYLLFGYAARHWAEHFLSAGSISPPELQESVNLLSNGSSSIGLNWLRFYWHYAEMHMSCPRDFSSVVTASYFGHLSSLKFLLRKGISIESDIGAYSVYWASRMGHRDVVDLLLREEISPDKRIVDGQNALIAAVQFNRLDVVKRLLKDEGFIFERNEYRVNHAAMGGRTPLSIAACNGFVDVARQLLQHSQIQPDIADIGHWTPLFWSVAGKNLDMVRLLITDGRVSVIHADRSGRNTLSWAASAGELELVRYLMSLKDVRADEPDHKGRSALSWAAGNGHMETVAFLLRSGRVDQSRKDRDGRSALSWACAGGHHKVVKYWIQHDSHGIDEEDVDGWTPLAWALLNNAPQTVQILLDSGLLDVNKKDRSGRSALSFAAGYGYLDIVEILLKIKGIDVEGKDNEGRTPLSRATRHPEIVKKLQGLKQ
ncbi:hypothetical protein VC83_07280 [Pseudogymnoascus destructans]|uniref:Nephrocystin 3-like N-terminal domain-containing protein n=1 Tax=Pseudogymnoascus destructans TaxID=655981 RepID=A0A177A392_9PEZI|nr:uncharacterized protein VC83_07280 [Pseudogymnoascus destructans]OAF56656.2 hypothetical protein VC83_07280 [Pseudogymnoascus destructans]